jgi:hypothetical protein
VDSAGDHVTQFGCHFKQKPRLGSRALMNIKTFQRNSKVHVCWSFTNFEINKKPDNETVERPEKSDSFDSLNGIIMVL